MRAPRIFGAKKFVKKMKRIGARRRGSETANGRMGETAKRRIRRCASLIMDYSLREMVRQCPTLNKPQSSWLLAPGSWLLFFAYFAATGTGITSLPSFSAMKLSLVPDELPLASLVSAVIFNFFVGFNGSFNFVPPGPS